MAERGCDVAVIGAGPAGLAAACSAAEAGARVAMVDDNPQAGGQIWRASETPWMARAARLGVELIASARVIAAPAAGELGLETSEGESVVLRYGALVLATGARELFLPFPGWTLPNVMGAGGLQALVKSGWPVERKKVIVAGSGPLLVAVAKYVRSRGARVVLIAEQASRASLLRFAWSLAMHPAKLAQAAGMVGIAYQSDCWPIVASGRDKLETVTLRCGDETYTEACDYLACGFGLTPNLELAALLGCRLSRIGVWVDEYQETSVRGVYGAGEMTGIGGLDLALVEGKIAGRVAAGRRDGLEKLWRERERHRNFARALETAFALRDELKTLTAGDTLVCRCEDVSLDRIRAASSWREAKLHTRCGMGACQGRICGPAAEFLLGWKAESVRPPLFPARVGSLTPGTE